MHNLSIPVQAISLWQQMIFMTRYRDWSIDAKKIINAIDTEAAMQQKPVESGVAEKIKTAGLLESDFNFLGKKDKYPILSKLEDFFKEAVLDVVTHALPRANSAYSIPQNIKLETTLTECWYHKTNGGGAHGAHNHPGSSWSGIFYVQTEGCSIEKGIGINRWHNVNSINATTDWGGAWWLNNNVFDVKPLEGHLVLFPSWLLHEGTSYKGEKDRIIISFNSVTKEKNNEQI
jgi:uncharacterized protein (TIGR02466 family)